MTFSEFLDLLKKYKIDFDYDSWNHIDDNPTDEYSFRIYLREDKDD